MKGEKIKEFISKIRRHSERMRLRHQRSLPTLIQHHTRPFNLILQIRIGYFRKNGDIKEIRKR